MGRLLASLVSPDDLFIVVYRYRTIYRTFYQNKPWLGDGAPTVRERKGGGGTCYAGLGPEDGPVSLLAKPDGDGFGGFGILTSI